MHWGRGIFSILYTRLSYHRRFIDEVFSNLIDLLETLRKLCLSAELPYQEIRSNYGILRSDDSV